MKPSKKKKLEAAGWKVSSAEDFLELSDADATVVDNRCSLESNVPTCQDDSHDAVSDGEDLSRSSN